MWRYRKLSAPIKIIAILIVLVCLESALEIVAAHVLHYSNFVSNSFEIVEFGMLWAAFGLYVTDRRTRLLFAALAAPFIILFFLRLPSMYNPAVVAEETSVVSRVILIALSVITLHSLLERGTSNIVSVPMFWVLLGVLLYSAGTMVVMGLANRLLKLGVPYFEMAWRVNWLLLVVQNVLYTKAFLCNQPR